MAGIIDTRIREQGIELPSPSVPVAGLPYGVAVEVEALFALRP
jgi:hypothetical protein